MGKQNTVAEPQLLHLLITDTRFAPLWLIIRIYVGWQWIEAGYAKIMNPLWVGPHAGGVLHTFLLGALKKSMGAHPDVPGWYAQFLSHVALPNTFVFSHMVALGEFCVGAALILGLFTGIAAFFGGFMNLNYLFAGTLSSNPLLLVLEFLIMVAWRVAGWIGLDRYTLTHRFFQ